MEQWNEDLISADSAITLYGLFLQRLRRSPDLVAYKSYSRESSSWKDYTWRDMARQIACWQRALADEGLAPGDRVAIQLRNSPEWVVFDQACQSMGLVVVPLYTDDRPENTSYILADADVKLLLIRGAGRWSRLAPELGENRLLQRVLMLDPGREMEPLLQDDDRLVSVSDWLPESGGELCGAGTDGHVLASIIYTSGTTGRPKGVMLSHHNILSVAHGALVLLDCYREDLFLSFLPLSHTFERTCGYYLPIMTGSTVAYSRSVAQLAEDLQTLQPTLMIAVPRIFERVYGRIREQLKGGSGLAARIFDLAVHVGWERFQWQQGRAPWRPQQLLWPLLNRLVAAKIKAKLGGRLRAAVSGGAPLSPEIAEAFIGLGIPILQGYGLTETSPNISVNPMEDNIPASVGVPLRNVEVCIGENDELLVKSPGVMLGYWNNHAATARMIDSEGWLHTGDQARIDQNNHIYITGRIKDILVLSNGEKVPPSDMELAITLDPIFEQAVVIGEGRPYLSALVVLNGDLWPGLTQELGLDPMAPASLQDSRLSSLLLGRIRDALKDFPGYAKIRRVSVCLEPWTIENGLLTPTLKIKRAMVFEHNQDAIDQMYGSGPAAPSRR
ncbi:MAG: long-chain fatty acid--CoA ligase [Gammaproteobacteria bacterium]|nr:long-chain fatty acid--CoA ligase [Gammaproteobacteria bacterium]